MPTLRSVAIVGAAGSCGRQLATQLLDRQMLHPDARLQLVAHHGSASEFETHGLRSDLRDAFADTAPSIELVDRPEEVDADIIVMLAGSTVPSDPTENFDRVLLAKRNLSVFASFADALAKRTGTEPLVIVQSNPVELGVEVFSRVIDRHRVVGAGAYSDTIRFRREIADSLGVRRSQVSGFILGQHGDHLVPIWSTVAVDDIDAEVLASWIADQRKGRGLHILPDEIVTRRAELLGAVANRDVHGAFANASRLPPDVRAAVKPFLVHTTAGHTTEIVTAHAVADLIDIIVNDRTAVVPLQVKCAGDFRNLTGVGGLPVRLTSEGWTEVVDLGLADDEYHALERAFEATAAMSTLIEES